jgi:hypothetical protein
MKHALSRRSLLKGSAAAGAVAIFNAVYGFSQVLGQAADDDTQTIINLAATAELFATTHYLAAINNAEALGLADIQLDYMKAGFLAEQDHLELLTSLGAVPVFTEFYVPENLFSDIALFASITEIAETTFVSAYLAANRIWSQSADTAAFAVTAAQIAGVEAEHRALVRQIGGLLANNQSYAMYQFGNVSDAVPVLLPFLDGSGEGFVGPIAPPTADDIAAIRAEADALGYVVSLPYPAIVAQSSAGSSEGSSSAAMADCTVTAGTSNVNIRTSPSTSATVAGVLAAGASTGVNGQRSVAGFTWWQRSEGGWIRGDAVTESDGCSALPSV